MYRNKKILYFVNTFAILGDLESVVADKLNWLSEHGFHISLLIINFVSFTSLTVAIADTSTANPHHKMRLAIL